MTSRGVFTDASFLNVTWPVLPQLLWEKKFWSFLHYIQVDSEAVVVGKAAIANLLGGIGYFYGQSKISVPQKSDVSSLSTLPAFLWLSLL